MTRIHLIIDDSKYIKQVAILEKRLWDDGDSLENYIELEKIYVKNNAILLLMDSKKPIGYLKMKFISSYDSMSYDKNLLYIDGLYIDKPYRGNGYALELMKAAEDYAKKLELEYICSDYYETNDISRNLHNKLGYEETSKLINVIKKLN